MLITAIEWVESPEPAVRIIDQTRLPEHTVHRELTTVPALIEAITTLAVRGAPALGVAGAYGVALAMHQGRREGWNAQQIDDAVAALRDARPTAVNLAWGVDQVRPAMSCGIDAVLAQAHRIRDEDVQANRALSRAGADWLLEVTGKASLRMLTHCNTGVLATAGWGTALGIVRELHERTRVETVYVDETRPLLQGSRLTAWELGQLGIDHRVQVDGAAASTILRGLVDCAVVGADRIAANGDTANKVGTLGVALACQAAGIPFVVAAPSSTVDLDTVHGGAIVIEERPADEVLAWGGHRFAPETTTAFNPAFDVTPHRFISAVVTENGVWLPNA